MSIATTTFSNSFAISSNPKRLKKQILDSVQPVLSNSVKELSYIQAGRITRRWNNLVITFSVPLDQADADPQASLVITKNLLISAGIEEDDLYDAAIRNIGSEVVVQTMAEALGGLGGVSTDEVPIYVVSNRSRIRGAAMILSNTVMNQLHECLGSCFAILPSSIHEILATPIKPGDKAYVEELLSMVREINATEVDPEDQLADCVYIAFDHKITVIQ